MSVQSNQEPTKKDYEMPLPWRLQEHGIKSIGDGVVYVAGGAHRKVIIQAANGRLMEIERLVFEVDDAEAMVAFARDARLVVRAVNSLASLVKALEAALHAMRSYQHGNESDELANGTEEFARAALSAAQEQSNG